MRLQQELEHQATHDALSGCLNRPAILSFLAEQLKADAAKPEGPAAVFVDLDRFKSANDLYGHAVGDEILAAVGGRLRNILRPGDAAGRLGGDEFLRRLPSRRIGDRGAAPGRPRQRRTRERDQARRSARSGAAAASE